jgi:tRNA A37 threonylcarbamoyladenosine modification protein TsaB
LIGISTLKILANSLDSKGNNILALINDKGNYFYLSKYNSELDELIPPRIEFIDHEFLNKMIDNSTTVVVNDSSSYHLIDKILNKKVNLIKNVISSSNMTRLSQKSFNNNKFEDIAYAEPVYVKKPYVD